MNIWIGAESIVSPLANTASDNFELIRSGERALAKDKTIAGFKGTHCIAHFSNEDINLLKESSESKIEAISKTTIRDSLSRVDTKELGRTLFILSTTKGDIDRLEEKDYNGARPTVLCKNIIDSLAIQADMRVVSMACISGILAIINAHDLIKTDSYDSVIVIGVDVISRFTLSGFDSFFALSNDFCKPYDANRKGLNLGEAASSIIISNNKKLFKEESMIFSGGAASNDANHISGPSRTGEGLVRAIEKALLQSETEKEEIDFISSHGTATLFNDDMESIAFERTGLMNVPTSSFKGYYGHTLGAAGVLETAICLQSMRNNLLIKNIGLDEKGLAKDVNILTENKKLDCNTILKTASGFGGCNAAGIIKKAES